MSYVSPSSQIVTDLDTDDGLCTQLDNTTDSKLGQKQLEIQQDEKHMLASKKDSKLEDVLLLAHFHDRFMAWFELLNRSLCELHTQSL